MKLEEYEECIQNCDLALNKIESFTKYSSFTSNSIGSSAFVIPLKSKILLRKSKSLHKKGNRSQAQVLVKAILDNDEKNTEAKQFQSSLLLE